MTGSIVRVPGSIVVGSAGLRSSLLGSISADVSRRAPCPVVVVPPGADVVANGSGGTRFGAGIARVAPGTTGGDNDFAGGIARLILGMPWESPGA